MEDIPSGPFSVERPASLGDQAFEALRAAIVNGTFRAGTRLTENGIAKRLNISKTPIREALLRLEAINLLVRERDGLYVPFTTPTLLDDAYQLRLALEPYAAILAGQNARKIDLERLANYAERTFDAAEQQNSAAFRMNDISFHKLIGKISGNRLLSDQINDVIDLIDIIRFRETTLTSVSLQCAKEHMRIVDYLAVKNSKRASTELKQHIEGVHKRVRRRVVADSDLRSQNNGIVNPREAG